MGEEFTLLMIKPDAVKRRLIGEIIKRVEDDGFSVEDILMKKLTREEAEEFYKIHRGKDFFEKLVDYITSGKIVAILLKREKARRRLREIIGNTDPAKAAPGTIRGDFGIDITHNVVHASNPDEDPDAEINFFFGRKSG